ncbi:MAG: segregation/condensation protein A [Tissierellia bacterium]|nr:segregation/condensation protein A [Tissierellia bacterium]
MYSVQIDVYEGPMDLLLQLIKENEIDIYDIPIALITEQFINHVNKMAEMDMELSSEFLVMATILLEIKSKMLLPKMIDAEEEELDPRQELVDRILEYQKYKELSETFKDIEAECGIVCEKLKEDISEYMNEQLEIDFTLYEMVDILNNLLKRFNEEKNDISELTIHKDEYTVEHAVKRIKNKLFSHKEFVFTDLFIKNPVKSNIISYFIAILEMAKMRYIYLKQSKNHDNILISRREI